MKPKVLLSWSSGKDAAWALHILRLRGEFEVVGLVTTFKEAFGRVAMHGVRAELVQAQTDAAGLQRRVPPEARPLLQKRLPAQPVRQLARRPRHGGD